MRSQDAKSECEVRMRSQNAKSECTRVFVSGTISFLVSVTLSKSQLSLVIMYYDINIRQATITSNSYFVKAIYFFTI
jgi:hypothetical protein